MPNVPFDGTFPGWRAAARALLAAGVPPERAVWQSAADAQAALALGGAGEVRAGRDPETDPLALDLDGEVTAAPAGAADMALGATLGNPPGVRVPRRFLALASLVACHQDPARWGALYRVLWRLTVGGEPQLLAVSVDEDVLRLTRMAKAVQREVHTMHAFVRFRAVGGAGPNGTVPNGAALDAADAPAGDVEYVAWFEPEHHVVERAAAFFARRFPNMRWAILTPRGCARWDGRALAFGPGVGREAAAGDDALEALWGTYYAHIFNPARVKLAAMRTAMPKKYWRNLPEARLIDGMVRGAPARVRRMVAVAGANEVGRTGGGEREGTEGGGTEGGRSGVARVGGGRIGGGAEPAVFGGGGVRVGTGGWPDVTGADDAWYPEDARTPDARLRHYAARFPLAVVDGTHRTLPTRRVTALWAERTPDGFLFDVRAHAAMTGHPVEPARLPRRVRDLLPPSLAARPLVLGDELPGRVRDAVWADVLDALAPLEAAGRLGAVLLRFPRGFLPSRANADQLRATRDRLGTRLAAVEFGDRDWFAPRLAGRTLGLLERLGFAHTVVVVPPGFERAGPAVAAVTHPALAVVRVQISPAAGRDLSGGSTATLEALVPTVTATAERTAETHVVLDTHDAPRRAAAFLAMLRARGATDAAPEARR